MLIVSYLGVLVISYAVFSLYGHEGLGGIPQSLPSDEYVSEPLVKDGRAKRLGFLMVLGNSVLLLGLFNAHGL